MNIHESIEHLKVPLADLNLDAANARKHGPKNLAAVKASLERFGQRQPIVVQKQGMVVRVGNARTMVARELGWTHIAATVVDETDVEATAYAIADNRTGELAEWDEEVLSDLLGSLDEDLQLAAGFSDEDLGELAKSLDSNLPKEVVEDEVPEDAPTRAQLGDVWALGDHRLLCGDSTDALDVGRLLGDVKPWIMVTDPPYGVNYDAEWRLRAESIPNTGEFGGYGKVSNDDKADWKEAWELFPGDVAYVWHGGLHAKTVAADLNACDFDLRAQIIWAKSKTPISRGAYHWGHEPCWYAVRAKKTADWGGDRKQNTVWEIPTNAVNESGHSTQKPVECMARPIRNHDLKGRAVYDPFLGSGTTLIAAEQLGQVCYGVELEPKYCDIILKRWEDLTGKTAEKLEPDNDQA